MAKVLVVEDEPLVARMMEKVLKTDGLEVEVGIMGREGLEKAKNTKPDLVILDIMMPEPDGIEVLEKLKADLETANIPVVILTNLSGKHDRELALSKGAADYWVKKDLNLAELGKRVKTVLEKKNG